MRRLYLFCGLLIVVGLCRVIRQPFMPFDGMILIGVGVILPVQAVLLRWLETEADKL